MSHEWGAWVAFVARWTLGYHIVVNLHGTISPGICANLQQERKSPRLYHRIVIDCAKKTLSIPTAPATYHVHIGHGASLSIVYLASTRNSLSLREVYARSPLEIALQQVCQDPSHFLTSG